MYFKILRWIYFPGLSFISVHLDLPISIHCRFWWRLSCSISISISRLLANLIQTGRAVVSCRLSVSKYFCFFLSASILKCRFVQRLLVVLSLSSPFKLQFGALWSISVILACTSIQGFLLRCVNVMLYLIRSWTHWVLANFVQAILLGVTFQNR